MDSVDVNANPLSDWVIVKIGCTTEKDKSNGKFRLRCGLNSIGRHSASDVRIDSALVSRHHAEIAVPDNKFEFVELKDLNSINGTYVNNKLHRADTAILREGDIISFGAEYDEDDVSQLPIYRFKMEPFIPPKREVLEIVISDDENLDEEIDIKPVIPPQPAEKIAVSNILTIFGNVDDTILDGLQRINPVVCEAVKKTSNAELVVLSSDDEEPEKETNSKDVPAVSAVCAGDEPHSQVFSPDPQLNTPHNEKKYDSESEESNTDENQLIYSQALIEEMKSEMIDESNDENERVEDQEAGQSSKKQEPLSPPIISLIDDNDNNSDDFDEDLERKVSNWSNLLFCSQVYPKMNHSQALIPDHLSYEYDSHDAHHVPKDEGETTTVSDSSLIENLFKPIEEKLDSKKRTLEEKPDSDDQMSSPVGRSKKRRIMLIEDDSEESDKPNDEPLPNIQILEQAEKRIEVQGKSLSTAQSKCRLPILVSPPHLKFGRRKSTSAAPKHNLNGFLEKKKQIKHDPKLKELRKERLKSISSNSKKTDENVESAREKRKENPSTGEHKSTTKVKNTAQNRGAFLCDMDNKSAAKKASCPHSSSKPHNNASATTAPVKSLLPLNFFAPNSDSPEVNKCITECKKILRKRAEQARARSAPKKLRFADVERSYNEQRKIEEKTKAITSKTGAGAKASTASPTTRVPITSTVHANLEQQQTIETASVPVTSTKKIKKTVRFQEKPTIYYFESHCEYSRKVDRKDIMPRLSYRHRRALIRRTSPTVDRKDDIISLILSHSNEWLKKQSSAVTALADSEGVSSIPSTFDSFEHYKQIFFPLMKLEFMSSFERELAANSSAKGLKFVLEDVINNKERILLVTKCTNSDGRQMYGKKCDLVLLKIGDLKTKVFAYMISCGKNINPGDRFNTNLFVEILPNSIDANYLRKSKTLSIQPAIDNLQVTIGAYNAIHQLEASPLYEMLLKPSLLMNSSNTATTQLDHEIASEFFHDDLNAEQLNAIKKIYRKICFNKTETTPNVSLIQGPPGTGKSVVVVNLALQIIYGLGERFRNKKILICSQSNCAIDSVAAKLLDARTRIKDKKQRFVFVRFGIFEKMHPKVHPVSLHNLLEFERVKKLNQNFNPQFGSVANWKSHLQKIQEDLKALHLQAKSNNEVQAKIQEKTREFDMLQSAYKNALSAETEHSICKNYLGQCNIVCTTLSSCVKLFQWIDYFDVCIIDEATQCTEPWTLLPLKFGISSLVLVGDSQQLPATVLSKQAAESGLTRSLHTRIESNIIDNPHSSNGVNENDVIFSLRVQYRMHPEICKFPNSFFYKGMLVNAEKTLQNTTPLMPYSVFNLEYAQNRSSCQGKIINQLEADFVVELLKALNEYIPIEKNTYGVITPYAYQRKILSDAVSNASLPHVTVNTIDSYQGLEKDVIVISNARTNGVGFLANPQRLNVAITRPKKCLILCGNFRNLQSVPAWRCLLKDAQQRNIYYEIGAFDISDVKAKVIQRILAKK